MKRRLVSVLMAGTMCASFVMGANPVTVMADDEYEVNFAYVVSNTMADQDAVSEAFSALAEEEIGMKVNLIPLTYVDALNQIPLMLSGGDPLDVFPAWSNTMSTYVGSGYVEDISQYWDKMPNVMQWSGEEDLGCCTIDGVNWGVPVQKEQASAEAVFMRKDILDELGIDGTTVEGYDGLTEVFEKVHEAYPDMTVLGGASYESIADMGDVSIGSDSLGDELGVLDNYGADTTVVNEFETDAWKEAVEVTRKWYEAGYISKDMPISTDSGETMMAAGNTFAFANNYKPDSVTEKLSTTGYELVPVLVSEPMTNTQMVGGVGYCIASTSADPEKAAEFLDWLVGSGEANDLLNWGVEGTHWVEDENGNATYPDGVTAEQCGYHNGWGFIMPNQFAGHLWTGNDPDLYDQYKEFKDNAHKSAAYGFTFDSSMVTNEVIACQAVMDEYIASICTGSVDPEPAIEEMNQALYDSGLQDIIDAKQEQLDAWLAEK